MWIVGSSGMTLFLYATLLKNAILELKKQVDTDVGSVYVNIFNYDVTVFSQSIESALSLFCVFHGPAWKSIVFAGKISFMLICTCYYRPRYL